jgi:hypothetical protein
MTNEHENTSGAEAETPAAAAPDADQSSQAGEVGQPESEAPAAE